MIADVDLELSENEPPYENNSQKVEDLNVEEADKNEDHFPDTQIKVEHVGHSVTVGQRL